MNSTDVFWDVNGQSLQNYAYNIETWGGDRQGVPSLRGDDTTIPFAPGDQWNKKIPGSRTFSMSMWVVGANEDGTVPAGGSSREVFEKNWKQLKNLLWTPNKQITLTKRFREFGSSEIIEVSAKAQFAGGLTPTMDGTQRARFIVQLKLADPFFYGEEETVTLTNGTNIFNVPGDYETNKVKVSMTGALNAGTELSNDMSTGVGYRWLGTPQNSNSEKNDNGIKTINYAPSFKGPTTDVEVYKNYAPFLDGATTDVEVRRNIHTRSRRSSTWDTASTVTLTPISDPRFKADAVIRNGASWVTAGAFAAVEGETLMGSIRVAFPEASVVTYYNPFGGASPPSGTDRSGGIDHGDGTFTLWRARTFNASGTFSFNAFAGAADGAIFGDIMLERTTEFMPFFDGSYSSDPDLTPSWTGAANASPSILTGPRPAGYDDTIYLRQDGQTLRVPEGATGTLDAWDYAIMGVEAVNAGQQLNSQTVAQGENRLDAAGTMVFGPGDWRKVGLFWPGNLASAIVGDGTWVEMRRNLHPRPDLSSGTSGWALTPGATNSPVPGGRSFTATRNISSEYVAVASHSAAAAVTAGQVVSLGFSVRNTSAASITMFAAAYPSDGTANVGTGINGSNVTIPAGDTRIVKVEGVTVPAGASVVRPVLFASSGGVVSGSTWVIEDGVTVMESPLLTALFSGSKMDVSLPQPEDFRVRWLGTENASESVMEIERVAGMTANSCIAGVSTWEGKPAARLIPLSSATDSQVLLVVPTQARPLVTSLGTLHMLEEITGSLSGAALGLRLLNPSVNAQAPNLPGTYPLRLTANLDSSYSARWYHGGAKGSGDVWWTDIGLFAGNPAYYGPLFDSYTQSPDPDMVYEEKTGYAALVGKHLNALTDSNCISIVTADQSEIRQIPTSTVSNSYVQIPIPAIARSSGTLIGTLTLPTPLSGALDSGSRSLRAADPPQQEAAPNITGTYPLRLAFTTTSGHLARIYHGGTQGSGEVRWSQVGLFAGVYDGPWFDGDSPDEDFIQNISSLTYNRAITSGNTAIIDVEKFKSIDGTVKTTGYVDNYGSHFWLPIRAGDNSIQLTAAGAGTVTITYRPAYL